MKSKYIAALSIVAAIATKGLCVSGFAVSSVQVPCNTGDARFYYGKIVKYTIQNDNVTRCDTIYKTFRATYPQLNLVGTQCAFLRRSIGQTGVANGPDDTKAHLSVMDINGGNVRDLDSFPLWIQNNNPQSPYLPNLIDWPAGDYVYYIKGISTDPCDATKIGSEIWKVKYNDAATKTRVGEYRNQNNSSALTFGMSLDGTRACVTFTIYAAGNCGALEFVDLPHVFPPATTPTKAGWDSKVWVGCGSYCSPSGKYHWHFFEGGHDNWRINTWNPPTELLATVDIASSVFPAWSVDKSLTAGAIGRGPMDWARWAVNSDKWICGCTDLYNMQVSPPTEVGHNQVLCDWIGHKIIVTSRNWQASSAACDRRNSCPGDMWIAGGPASGNAYEGIDGNWYDAITHAKVQNGTVGVGMMPGGYLSVKRSFAGNGAAAVFDLRGSRIGNALTNRTRHSAGVCIAVYGNSARRAIMPVNAIPLDNGASASKGEN
jgi:hypothetical protein